MEILVLVPTRLELDRLNLPSEILQRTSLCGFGPVASAARAAGLLARRRYDAVILAGIAGTYDAGLAPLGEAVWCSETTLDGVGAGEGDAFLSPDRLGFPLYVDEAGDAIGTTLTASDATGVPFLTVCAASGDAEQAARRKRFYPGVGIEEMEGFGVALAARLAGVAFHCVRGVSNVAGDRRVATWKIDEALAAVRRELLARCEETGR